MVNSKPQQGNIIPYSSRILEGKAKKHYNVRLTQQPSGEETQPIAVGVDPGQLYSGVGVQSPKATLVQLLARANGLVVSRQSIACFGGIEPHSASAPIPPHPQGDAVSRRNS
nr:RRXRR domain-containing protein [Spirulina subsalsa]